MQPFVGYNSACNEIAWAQIQQDSQLPMTAKGKHGSVLYVYDVLAEILDWFGPPSRMSAWFGFALQLRVGLEQIVPEIIFAADYVEQGIHTLIFDADVNFILGCTDYTARNYNPHMQRQITLCEWLSDETFEDNYIGYWDNCSGMMMKEVSMLEVKTWPFCLPNQIENFRIVPKQKMVVRLRSVVGRLQYGM